MKKITFLLLLTTFGFSVSFIVPIPEKISYDKEKALLGKKLFFETRLSKTNTISCNSCHNLTTSGTDNLQFSFGIDAQVGNINSPWEISTPQQYLMHFLIFDNFGVVEREL
jgi:cytochrome c peroxidase